MAPARNRYNENLFYLIGEVLEEIGEEIEYDIIFIIRFCIVIFLLLVALFSFRYMNKIIGCLERLLGKKRASILPAEFN